MKRSATTGSIILFVVLLSSSCSAYSINRRTAGVALASAAFGIAKEANAIEACKPGANNCVQGTLVPPSSASKDDVINQLRSVINAYPQAGQSGVDEGGWSIASDDLDNSSTMRVEYKSSGKGTFAKLFNGGKPFVDDLKLEVQSSGDSSVVKFKSASRVGDSDFGVNGKRMDYIKASLGEKGWSTN